MTDSDRALITHLAESVNELHTSMLQLHNLVADHKMETRVEGNKIANRLEALIIAYATFCDATGDRADEHSARMDKNALEAIGRIEKIERSAAWVRAWSAGAAAVLVAMFGAVVWVGARLPSVIDVLANGGK